MTEHERPGREKGLSSEEHRLIDNYTTGMPGADDEKHRRIQTARDNHSDDPKAQREIDVYDSSSEYHQKVLQYRDAVLAGDKQTASELEAWFRDNNFS